jgi:hypothetical protein
VTGGIRRTRAAGARRLWRVLGIGCGTPRSRHRPIAHTVLRSAEPRPLSSRDVAPNRPQAGCRGEQIDPGSAHQAATATRGPLPGGRRAPAGWVSAMPPPGRRATSHPPAAGRPRRRARPSTSQHEHRATGTVHYVTRSGPWRPDPQLAPVERNHADRRERRRSNVYRHRTNQPDPTATTPAATTAAAREWWLSS